VLEDYTRNFDANWTGTGAIGNAGVADTERLEIEPGENMVSDVWNTGVWTVEIAYNVYAAGDTVTVKYRTDADPVDILALGWTDYTVPFESLGYVQVRLEAPA
jgi:hypothetical protein